jgi:hypothetical protein
MSFEMPQAELFGLAILLILCFCLSLAYSEGVRIQVNPMAVERFPDEIFFPLLIGKMLLSIT